MLRMDEVAVASALALALGVLTALGLPEVSDRAVLDVDGIAVVVLASHGPQHALSLLLCRELDVQIANHVLSNVVGHDHVQNLSLLAELEEDLLEELLEVVCSLDELLLRCLYSFRKGNRSSRIRIDVREQQRLRKWWLIVLSCATVAVATRSYLIVKWAIHLVVLSSELLCESVCHFGASNQIYYD